MTTGGTIARASAEGHRVVLVVATNGEHGEVPPDLAPGESLADRRRLETERSAEVLGVARVVWLGYRDSGMTGWEQNGHDESFHGADIEEAAQRLATVLREERADVLTSYDWHGGYGHPDHVQVHRVGKRTAELMPAVRTVEATMNRTVIVERMKEAIAAGTMPAVDEEGREFDPEGPADDGNPFGTPESEISFAVDVAAYTGKKRAAIMCHRSQVTDASFFLQMPDDAFHEMFATEYFIDPLVDPLVAGPMRPGWLFDIPT
jgi:LmbE family N-acetylglucosaminyl deacetylase